MKRWKAERRSFHRWGLGLPIRSMSRTRNLSEPHLLHVMML